MSDIAGFSEDSARDAIAAGYEELLKDIGRFNLAILGDAGVGKSSLVNAIFGADRAKTGVGAPVTQGVDYHLSDDGTFGVWDFEGFEHGAKLPPIKTLKQRLKENQREGNERAIHVAWFCWDASGARLTDGHRILIDALVEAGIPVIGVATKVHARAHSEGRNMRKAHLEFIDYLEQAELPLAEATVFPTAAVGDTDFDLIAHGLKDLLDATIRIAPDAVADAIRKAQVIDKESKRKLAWTWITAASVSAGSVAATPIPVASAAVLAPIQLALFGKIAAIYGTTSKEILGSAGLMQVMLQLTGKAAAQSLVKFIPIAGSAINATVASVWTAASGEVWRQLCEKLETEPDGAKVAGDFIKVFGPTVTALFQQWMKGGGTPTDVE